MSVQFKEFTHLITRQAEMEKAFLDEYSSGQYTIENPYVKLNPYEIAPLTALVMFKNQKPAFAKVVVKGKEAAGDMMYRPVSDNINMVLPIYGLYPGYDNTVVITLSTGEEKVLSIKTDEAPEKVKFPSSVKTTPDYFEDNVMFVSPTTAAMPAAYDYAGDVRWFMTINGTFDIKRVRNGRLLMGTDRLVAPPYHTTGLYEFGVIGKIYKEYRLPGAYHHDQWEMENGKLLVLTQDFSRGTVEDLCVMIDRDSGEILKTWDFQKVLPQYPTGGSGSQDAHDWFHNNAVWYDKKTNTLSFSGRHQDIIINLDFETGDLNWIIGDPEGWPQELVDKYFFKPVGDLSKFDWQYEQHACMILPNGDVMCFDNGHWRSKVKEKYVAADDNFSRGVIYRIDTDKMEIEQVWQYGKELGKDFFSTYICNCEYYADGHYMVHSGGLGSLRGVTCDSPASRYIGTPDEVDLKLNSITVEIKDDEIVYEMQIPGANYYRAEKLRLYDAADVVSFGPGQLLGSLGVTEEFSTEAPAEEAGIAPDEYNIRIGLEEDRLIIKARFEKGTLVMLNLEGENDLVRRYFIPTTRRPFTAMCVGTFIDSDERAVEFPISREGIAGKYKITITIDEKKYDTGLELEL